MELLTICIKTTYFQLKNEFFQQDFGMAMGSSLSPVLSNIFMEYFEENFIQNYNCNPKIWWRYVDDVFSVWPHGLDNLNQFLNFINNQEPSIKFTLEIEEDNKLPFLDVLVIKSNLAIQTNLYKKKTNTNRYLNFNSNHHISIKRGIVKCLYDRAKLINSNTNNFVEDKSKIINILIDNDYPKEFVERTISVIENPLINEQPLNVQNHAATTCIPYIPGLSDRLRRLGNKFNVRTAFRTTNTLRSILSKTKPINTDQSSKNCVYSIPCECGKCYVGETCRPLNTRVNEHKKSVRDGNTEGSKLAQHVWDNGHRMLWNDTKILSKESKTIPRKIKESAYIQLQGDNCISSESIHLDSTWMKILENEIA